MEAPGRSAGAAPGGASDLSARRRLRSSTHEDSQERPARIAAGERFFYVTDEEALRVALPESPFLIKGTADDALLKEAERCWAEHYEKGLSHTQPPWRLCRKLDDNREHPLSVRWLDTVEIPSLAELLQSHGAEKSLQKESKDAGNDNGNDKVIDNSNSFDESKDKDKSQSNDASISSRKPELNVT